MTSLKVILLVFMSDISYNTITSVYVKMSSVMFMVEQIRKE